MHSVGTTLRRARDQQHRTLSEIAEATRIPYHYLEAIESDDVGAFPGNFFYKNFVRQYCSAIEVPYESVDHRVERMLLPEVEDPLKALCDARTEPRGTPEPDRSSPRRVFWPSLLLLLVLGGGSGIYAWRQIARRQPAVPDGPIVSSNPPVINPVSPPEQIRVAPIVPEERGNDVGTRSRRRRTRRSRLRSARRGRPHHRAPEKLESAK
jgi:hypothetical protein